MTDQEKELEQQSIMRRVDSFTEPARMSQPEALVLIDELGSRTAALKEEMGEDPEDVDVDEDEEDGT